MEQENVLYRNIIQELNVNSILQCSLIDYSLTSIKDTKTPWELELENCQKYFLL